MTYFHGSILKSSIVLSGTQISPLYLNSIMALSRFRAAKTAEEEVNLVRNAVPKSTQYKNKWPYAIFQEWQRQRLVKVPIVEVAGFLKPTIFI